MVSRLAAMKPTVVSFQERKPKTETPKPRPIRPPVLNGHSPNRQQLQQTMKCAGALLLGEDQDEQMLMYRAIEAITIVTRPTPGLDDLKYMELVVLCRGLNRILNDIKAVGG